MADNFAAYARLWLLTEGMLHLRQPFLVPDGWRIYWQLAFYAVAAFRPARLSLGIAMCLRVTMFIVQAPMIWDSSIWANFTDIAVIGALCVVQREQIVASCSDLIRVQMGLFYLAAGFWKINTAFLAPSVSCASVYVASLLAYLPEALLPTRLVELALASSPIMTILGEAGLGVCAWLVSTPRPLDIQRPDTLLAWATRTLDCSCSCF